MKCCPTHLEFGELIDEVEWVHAYITKRGSVGVVITRTEKVRCPDCGGVELVRHQPTHRIINNFAIVAGGLKSLVDRAMRGELPVAPVEIEALDDGVTEEPRSAPAATGPAGSPQAGETTEAPREGTRPTPETTGGHRPPLQGES
jgi:hypothetical protein